MRRHLKLCNKFPKPKPVYHVDGINRAPGEVVSLEPKDESDTSGKTVNLALFDEMPVESVLLLAAKIDRLYSLRVLEDGALKDLPDMSGTRWNFSSLAPGLMHLGKHSMQVSSLLRNLTSTGSLDSQCSFAEFGCGKAVLSKFINSVIGGPSDFLLIDRSLSRGKVDVSMTCQEHSETDEKSRVTRLLMDIADLDLSSVPALPADKPLVAYSKHLCGNATDLTLRCLAGYAAKGGSIKTVTIALCCHNRCTSSSLCGKEHLVGNSENMVTEDEFKAMCVMSSWTLSWFRTGTERSVDQFPAQGHWTGLSKAVLEQLGFKCKRLFDWARVKYLEEQGFEAKLGYYVERTVTPENVVLVATRKE
jgi:tRNA:m4X modification enzyme